MTEQETLPAVQQPKPAIAMSERGIQLRTFDDLARFANMIVSSGVALPEGMKNPQALAVAIELGMNVGLRPLQAIQSIAVINGRPSIWGKAGTALILQSGLLDGAPEEEWIGNPDGEDYTAVCRLRRKGIKGQFIGEFSIRQAKQMSLLGKQTYKSGLKDMLMWRARWRAYVAGFSDVLMGLTFAEVVNDEPANPIMTEATVLPADPSLTKPGAPPKTLEDLVARAPTLHGVPVVATDGIPGRPGLIGVSAQPRSPAAPTPEPWPEEPTPQRSAEPPAPNPYARVNGKHSWKGIPMPYPVPDAGPFPSFSGTAVGQGLLKTKGYTWGDAVDGSPGGFREKALAQDVAEAIRAWDSSGRTTAIPLHHQRAACALAMLRARHAVSTANLEPRAQPASEYRELFDPSEAPH